MKTLYISGPMTGYPAHNAGAFYSAATSLRRCGYDVVNPAEFHADGPIELPWAEYLRRDLILMLSHTGGIATLPNWWLSDGAQLEIDVAVRLGWEAKSVALWIEDASA